MDYWRNRHVIVTGGAGFLGSALVRKLERRGAASITVPRSKDFDLRRGEDIGRLFDRVLVGRATADTLLIHAAARVGGIAANRREPATYFYDNLMMGTQLLHEAWRRGLHKFVAIGTVCGYPRLAPVPFRETDVWNGYPEDTNAPYGLAKKMLLVQGGAYRAQYGFNSIFLLPTNLYGPGDNFDLEDGHVIPALVRKCVEARRRREPSIVAWGSGLATRDYLFVDDAAEGILLAAEHYHGAEPVNLSGPDGEISVRELLGVICRLTGYAGDVVWDGVRPDGQPRRGVDGRRARHLFGFQAEVGLEDGLRRTIEYAEQRVLA